MEGTTLDSKNPIHLIGGGGVGMSGLGHLLLNLGFKVSASDRNPGPYLEKLKEAGAVVWVGSEPGKIPENAKVFYSSAISPEDPERKFCAENNIPASSRHSLLGEITKKYHTVAISGTHGKTTTTGWSAFLFECAGIFPNALVGGTVENWKSNFRKGGGTVNGKPLLVIEADESDESFLFIWAMEIGITNIELDHVDNYHGIEDVKTKFIKFVSTADQNQGVFFPSLELDVSPYKDFSSFKKSEKVRERIVLDEANHALKINNKGDDITLEVGLKGRHNLWNASIVAQIGLYHDFSLDVISRALKEFKGVERRMQVLGSFQNSSRSEIEIMDDYGHHPTEIKMVMETLSKTQKNIIAVWEPHRVSRLLHFNEDFKNVFINTPGLENLFLIDIFDAAGEKKNPEFSSWKEEWEKWINRSAGSLGPGSSGRGVDYSGLLKRINQQKENTLVVFLGAGNSSGYAREFLKENSK